MDDLSAVHDLFTDIETIATAVPKNSNHPQRLEVDELRRRGERALGLAIRAGQARGEVLRRGDPVVPGKLKVVDLLPGRGQQTTTVYMMAGITDAQFESIIKQCRQNRNLSRHEVTRHIQEAVNTNGHKPIGGVPTARGRRTVEHMAIQINAIALGVAQVDPAEVNKIELHDTIFQVFEDIGAIRSFLRKVNKA